MNNDRQPWDDGREKLDAQANVIGAAILDVIGYLAGSAAQEVNPEQRRNMLGHIAYLLRRFFNSPNGIYLPMKQQMWIGERLKEATAGLPWKPEL